MDFANVVGECCQEQRAVADAFGTGQATVEGLSVEAGRRMDSVMAELSSFEL